MKTLARIKKDTAGHSVLEFVAVIVVIGILLAIIFASFTTIQRNRHNQQRETDINNIYQQLEAYYVLHSVYPTLADMNNSLWVKSNMPNLSRSSLKDPNGKSYILAATPQTNIFAYQVTAGDGGSCNNTTLLCVHYTLTATLPGTAQHTYVRSSLN